MPRRKKLEVTGEIPPTGEAMWRKQPADLVGAAPERVPRQPQICAAAAGGIALLALIGWLTNARVLAGQWGTNIPMAPSTALAFLLLGGALFCVAHWPSQRLSRRFALAAVSLVAVESLLVTVQFLTGVDWGLDRALFRTEELVGQTPVGRMSLLTAQAFLLQGLALLVLLLSQRWRHAPAVAAVCATIGTAIASVVSVGYAYGEPLLYGGPAIPMALPTGLAFLLAGFGQLRLTLPRIPALRAWSGNSTRGVLLRAFLPLVLSLLLLEGWVDVHFGVFRSSNMALWHSLTALMGIVVIVVLIGWIARRTGKSIEQAQEEIRSLARFPDESPQPVLRFTREGRLLYANRSSQPLLAHWHCEPPGEFLPERERRGIDEVLQSGVSRREEVTCGDTIYSLILAPIVEMDYVSIYGRDITARKRAVMSLKASEEEERRSAEQLTALIEVGNLLSSVGTSKELCRRAIELGREKLGFDRLGLWFTSEEPDAVTGTFGVDEQGRLRDEWGSPVTAGPGSVMWKVLHERSDWLREEDTPLYNHHAEAIGRGALAVAGLWDGERMIGCLSTDNLVRGEPLTDRQCQLLSLYGSELGHLFTRQRAEEALRKSEERFRTALESMMEGCQIIGFDWRYLYVNEVAARHGHRSRVDLVGRTMMEVYPGIETTEMFAALRRCMEGRTAHLMENEFTYPDGAKAWFDLSIQPVPEGIFILSFDITDRKRAEAALRESEARFSTLFHSSPARVALTRLEDGLFLDVNEGFLQAAGRERDEVVGHTSLGLEDWVDDEERVKLRNMLADRGSVRSFEAKLRAKSGEIRDVLMSADVIELSGQQCILSVALDITDRRRAEQALRESEERYRTLAEASHDMINVVNRQWEVEYSNTFSARQFGVLPADLIGKRLSEIFPPEISNRQQASLQQVFDSGQSSYIEAPAVFHGRTAWLGTWIVPIKDKDDGTSTLLVVSRDITERKQAEEALRESERSMRELVRHARCGLWSGKIEAITGGEDSSRMGDAFLWQIHPQPDEQALQDMVPLDASPDGFYSTAIYLSVPEEERAAKDAVGLAALRRGDDHYSQEFRCFDRDGRMHWIHEEMSLQPLTPGWWKVFGVWVDVTERRRAEEAVRENEQRLASIYNTVGDVIFHLAVEPEGQFRFESVNPAFLRVTGLRQDMVVGRRVNEIIPEPSLTMVLDKYRQAIEEKSIVNWEETSDYPNGRLTGEVGIAPVFDAKGTCTHLVGSVHDLTERKQAEEALRESEARYRMLVQTMNEGLIAVDNDDVIQFVNERMAQ
ncbi:MAG: PAS domain S-box protein, partial [Armatimonadetes bacterium]|nr:PAS domain S-box protein [Armatimonadota bacterium]